MKPDSQTSFGDKNRALNLPGMRDLLDANWAKRDRTMRRSPAELEDQFDPSASLTSDADPQVDRRDFMKLMGGTMALAGMTACTRHPKETIVPYVDAPEEIVPGKPLFFATAMPFAGFGQGLLAESHMGRPTKVEGNPKHSASLGATSAHAQASVLDLYDPDRSKGITRKGVASAFGTFKKELNAVLGDLSGYDGEGLHLVLGPTTSPTEAALIGSIQKAYPKSETHVFNAIGSDHAIQGAKLAFGKELQTVPKLAAADVVVSFDADFLGAGPDSVRLAHDYAERRRVVDHAKLNRSYVVESTLTITGGNADHRISVRGARVEAVARAIAADLGIGGTRPSLPTSEENFVNALVADLKAAGSHGLVLAGELQPPIVHAIANAINAKLGAIGTTIDYVRPQLLGPTNAAEDFAKLAASMQEGKVAALFMLNVNPVYGASADLKFAAGLKKVPFSVHLGLYEDETAKKSTWHLGGTHYLEAWGDVRAIDGTISIVQPLIAPLYNCRSSIELLSLIAGEELSGYEVVQGQWKNAKGLKDDEAGFNRFWRTSLHDGSVAKSKAKPVKGLKSSGAFIKGDYKDPKADFGLEVVIRQDGSAIDGEYSNNAWLQELPRPVSTLTWDHVITMSSKTAAKFGVDLNKDGLQNRDVTRPKAQIIELNVGDLMISGPVLVLPGHPDNSVSITLGGGRKIGSVAKDLGYNASRVRTTANRWIAQGATIVHKNRSMKLALTQDHFIIKDDARALVRQATADQFKKSPDFAGLFDHNILTKEGDGLITMYPEWDYSKGNQWGMVIDLGTCIGCNVCVTACQAENNIPTVGKEQVMNGREMHWVRVDRYTEIPDEGNNDNVRLHSQPMPCQQCENAPCETVCPVGATMHSNEGLNMMVYNRCVGTRYCSNNCPFKVRRYNYFKYTDDSTESLKFQRNPDVTVRLRGVMEKCTYCVQRINLTRIDAKIEKRAIKDGEIQTACQQACPTQAITFGDINDSHSRISKLRDSGLNYTLLNNLNVKPRTSYLAKVRNPNPVLEPNPKPLPEHHGGHHDDHGAGHGDDHGGHHGSDDKHDSHAAPAHKDAH